jgi:hypothetical protein
VKDRAWIAKAVLEVVLISTGVFLGLAAEQWRSDAQHREQARASIARFRAEIQANRDAVAKVKDYHVDVRKLVQQYLDADPKAREGMSVKLQGIRPVYFDHTAWDLSLATQALADIEPELAYEIARVYGLQQMYAGLTSGMTNAMYLNPPTANPLPFFQALRIYLGDITIQEPALLGMYDSLLPSLDRALAQ